MKPMAEQLTALISAGYRMAEAQSKVAHDAILYAMHKSGFKANGTIKGGVVMCELTGDIRRTTMDLDIDFVHCSISETSIRRVVSRWARLSGFDISIFGLIQELRQEDYRGKRVYLDIKDASLTKPLRTKVDIGVHTYEEIPQVERKFDALSEEKRATLFSNSKEQIFTEKLLSLLRHGVMSTRTKDVFDMYYLSKSLNRRALRTCLDLFILKNHKSPVRDPLKIIETVGNTFRSRRFLRNMSSKRSNWLGVSPQEVVTGLMDFLHRMF